MSVEPQNLLGAHSSRLVRERSLPHLLVDQGFFFGITTASRQEH